MGIEIISESNSEDIRKFLIDNNNNQFINDFFENTLPTYTPAQFRELFFSTNFICYADYENKILNSTAIFSLPPTDTLANSISIISFPINRANFFNDVLNELKILFDEEELKKITIYLMDTDYNQYVINYFKSCGFELDLCIPTSVGDYIHMSYYID